MSSVQRFPINWTVGWQVPVSNPDADLYEIDIYFRMQEEAIKKFGVDTLLLYQMGKFYEVYGREDDEEDERRVNAFAECCNLQDGAHKSTGIPKHRFKLPPRMLGFTDKALDKYRALLLNAGWTLVIVTERQQSSKGLRPLREITEIVSGSTHEDNAETSYTIASIYVEELPSNSSIRYYSMGVATLNTATGKASLHELTETKSHLSDYLHRLLLSYDPNEIMMNDTAVPLFELSSYRTRVIHIEQEQKKVSWMYDNILCRILSKPIGNYTYRDRQLMNQQLGIPSNIRSVEPLIAFTTIVSIIQEQSNSVITNIHCINESNTCVLYGNAIEQLAIFSKKSFDSRVQSIPSQRQLISRRWDSLYSLMDVCSTRFGSRLLHYRLSHPSQNRTELAHSHSMIEQLIQNKHFIEVRKQISNSLDGERIVRRIETNWKINPGLIGGLYRFIEMWSKLDEYLVANIPSLQSPIKLESWNKMKYQMETQFIIPALFENRASRWETPIKPNSELQKEIDDNESNWQKRLDYLELISETKGKRNKTIKICSNDSDGYTVQIPKKSAPLFTKWKKQMMTEKERNTKEVSLKVSKKQKDNFDDPVDLTKPRGNPDPLLGELKEATMKVMASNARLFHPVWRHEWMQTLSLRDRIHEENRVYMEEWRELFWQEWGEEMKRLIEWSAQIDVWAANAYISARYGYHKPELVESDQTVIEGEDLRHPMIERIQEEVAGYVANPIEITKDQRGMLLYGMNASGKSSYMKSVGLALIMSQAGCWVPCKNFRHSIITKIFTRISGNDDYMRGKSSFALEMEELSTILKSADETSVVLGDELCRGTEQVSGTAIVGAGINTLLNKGVAFVFATHLHDLPNLSILRPYIEIKKLLGVYHLRVITDPKTGQLSYERQLQEGQGSTLYGLEVAGALGLDRDTLRVAEGMREEILGFVQKDSRYNARKSIKVCEVCNRRPAVETHHLQQQKDADDNKIVDGKMRLNSMANLVGICEECHDAHHAGKIEIKGWKEAANGERYLAVVRESKG